jgi:hypothetical protein
MCRFALLALIAFCLLPATAVAKQPPLEFVSSSQAGISALDAHTGYYESPKGTLRIIDVQAGATRTIVLPERCEGRGVSLPTVLLVCYSDYRVFDSDTGETEVVDMSGCGDYARDTSLAGIGRYWIAGAYHTGIIEGGETGGEVEQAVYIDRETGACRVLGRHDFGRDLDRKDLPERRYGVPDKCNPGKAYVLRFRLSRLELKRCIRRAHWVVVCKRACGAVQGSRTVLAEHVYVSRWDADRTPIYTVDLSRVVGG